MVSLRLLRWSVVSLAFVGARPAAAAPINLTGNPATDFNTANPNVHVTHVLTDPNQVGPSSYMAQKGWVSGWAMKDIFTAYDSKSDTLFVGIDTFKNSKGQYAIIGDADGNGNPGVTSQQMALAGGVNEAHLGGGKTVAVAFAPDGPPGTNGPVTPVVIAGVPGDKTQAGTGVDGFNVATYKNLNVGLGYNFGPTLTNNLGALAFDPSAQHPGFEFTIKNFSKIPGIDPFKGFWIEAYAGSPEDHVVGEAALSLTRVPAFSPEIGVPEPATYLTWAVVAAGAVAARRRKREAPVA
jgi:hypothetical protein